MLQPKILFRSGVVWALPLLSAGLSQTAHADGKMVGVPGFTSGSQTFIRVRPSALTPPVAKVPARTQVYVWGRFGDWYRVETRDHIFGWVYKGYIDARRLHKIKTISHFKAIQASEKSGQQTLYGTPAELKAYYARYGGKGALKGLALKGIYLTPPPVVRVARGPRPHPHLAPRVALNVDTPTRTAVEAPTPSAPGTLLPPPTPEELGLNAPKGGDIRTAPDALAPDAQSLANNVRSWTPSAPATTSPTLVTRSLAAPANRVPLPAQTRSNLPRIALAPRSDAEQSRATRLVPVLPGNTIMAPPTTRPRAQRLSPEQAHIIAWQARLRAKQQRAKWLQAKRLNDWKWRQSQAQKKEAAARNRRLWLAKQRQNRWLYVSSRKGQQRRNVALRAGLIPKQMPLNVPGKSVAPVSPDEILKSREEYLKNNPPAAPQNSALSGSAAIPPVTPGLVPPVTSSPATGFVPQSATPMQGDLKGNLNTLLFGTPQQKERTAQELSASGASEESRGQSALTLGGPPNLSMPVPYTVSNTPTTTMSRTTPSRGGSPRDRALLNWRNGLSSQALSYRGMPYVFGSASPRRGFDCSGLVYFLLRQRGLNPPRTASGYAHYGQSVARGQWQAGDLILFANTYKHGISHIGVYLKDGKFVHAASTGRGVRVDSLYSGYFAHKYWGARRVK